MGVRDMRSKTGDSEAFRIRPHQPDDLDDLYRICLQTADNGQDATSLFRDPKLPGHVYVAPYVTPEPSLAFVAEDRGGLAAMTPIFAPHGGRQVRAMTQNCCRAPLRARAVTANGLGQA